MNPALSRNCKFLRLDASRRSQIRSCIHGPPEEVSLKYLALLLPIAAFSQNYEIEKIVLSSKRALNEDAYIGDVETITDFTSTGSDKVLDELIQLPGVSISQSGAPGQQAAIYIRGSEARHVLVLIDGVRVNDPSNTDKFYNGALLNLGDIEKIEVLKGSQTLLYGSEAMGGVINVITKKGAARNFVSAFTGFSNGLDLDHTLVGDTTLFHLHLQHEKSEGISAAKNGDEKDGFENKGATLNFSKSFGKNFEGDWTYKVLDQFVETDTTDINWIPVDSDEDYSHSTQQIFSQKLDYKKSDYAVTYLLGGNKMDRYNKAFGSVYNFNAKEMTNELHFKKETQNGSYLLGIENLSQTFSQSGVEDKFAGLTSLLFIKDASQGDWFWQYGARAAYHTEYESVFSPSFGVGKKFGGKKSLSLNYQRGFKSPTLYQLYGPDFGNTELDPETNDYVDLNFKQGEEFEASLFYNKIDGFIQYDMNEGYINSIYMEMMGLEAQSRFQFGRSSLVPGLFLAKYNLPGNEKVLRRPEQKATLSFERKIRDNQRLILDLVWVGERFDNLAGEKKTLDPYDVADLHYEIRMDDVLLNFGAENLFGKVYEEAYGYSVQPFTAYFKAKYYY